MITENLSTLKIHKLTQAQYDTALANGNIDENALYLTPDEGIDLSGYATTDQLNGKADAEHTHDDRYYTETEIDARFQTELSGLVTDAVANNKITTHNTSTEAHNDIRVLIDELTTKLNNFLDVDETTTDQLSEVLTLIENNKGTLESLTTSKVNVSDIVDNLTTATKNQVLSANQGVAIKSLIDDLQAVVDGKAPTVHTHHDLYYTKEEIDTEFAKVAYIDIEDSEDVADQMQLKPEFANNINECTDTTKLYVLPDGFIYAYMYSGAYPEIEIIEGGTGYWYWTGSGEAFYSLDTAYHKITNYIPVTEGDSFHYKGQAITTSTMIRASWYDANKTWIGYVLMDENSEVTITVPAGAKYARFQSLRYTSDNSAVVLEVEWEYCAASLIPQWANTGHAFIPADYETQILDLDSRVDELENSTSNILKGKHIVYDGDSLCARWVDAANNIDNGGAYPQIIADLTGCTFDNRAVGGGVIVSQAGIANGRHSVVDTLVKLPTDGDLYCFEGGVNDYSSESPIGIFYSNLEELKAKFPELPDNQITEGLLYSYELDTTTFCGALEQICRYSTENFLGKPICFIIVHKCPYCAYKKNDIGLTFADYREKMIGILEKYGIPYYDAWKESGLNGINNVHRANYFIFSESQGTGDGWHPNIEGYKKYYAPQLISLFERIMPR